MTTSIMTTNCNIPDDVLRKYNKTTGSFIPTKSSERYHKEYKQFCDWRRENAVSKINEEIMLAYLFDMSKKMFSSLLRSKYSMVRPLLQIYENVDISGFSKFRAFLIKQSVSYQPKQAKTLTIEDLVKFVEEAPDQQYLLAKIVDLTAIAGGCRREDYEEIYEMSLDDIEETSASSSSTLHDGIPRVEIIGNTDCTINV
ncbi:hypothetical protein Zmor_006346 [Zophobas morio]|uniref:Uncharacterized protein n=1 Tax=Zophobas morio TaxID=2755281 RepID=A0AA38IX71_9CUCU|nr:hypothetical protein Zmor_006346 [Zophobas morio]